MATENLTDEIAVSKNGYTINGNGHLNDVVEAIIAPQNDANDCEDQLLTIANGKVKNKAITPKKQLTEEKKQEQKR